MTVSGKTMTKVLDALTELDNSKLIARIMSESPGLVQDIHKYLKPTTQNLIDNICV